MIPVTRRIVVTSISTLHASNRLASIRHLSNTPSTTSTPSTLTPSETSPSVPIDTNSILKPANGTLPPLEPVYAQPDQGATPFMSPAVLDSIPRAVPPPDLSKSIMENDPREVEFTPEQAKQVRKLIGEIRLLRTKSDLLEEKTADYEVLEQKSNGYKSAAIMLGILFTVLSLAYIKEGTRLSAYKNEVEVLRKRTTTDTDEMIKMLDNACTVIKNNNPNQNLKELGMGLRKREEELRTRRIQDSLQRQQYSS